MAAEPVSSSTLSDRVQRVVFDTGVFDVHTHLYDPAFDNLLLWGIDDLLVYHYLVAETFRFSDVPYELFWQLNKREQADLVWRHLFDERSPISEACRGVVTTLNALGLDPRQRDLASLRNWFEAQEPREYVTKCMELAGVRTICMTNSPFDDDERRIWQNGFDRDPRFVAALRIDPLLLTWETAFQRLREWGYNVSLKLSDHTIDEVRRFLADWSLRIKARYVMVSLPPEFAYPDATTCVELIERAVLPHCRENNLPFAMMPGVKRGLNPALRLAGDGLGLSRMDAISNLCARFAGNRFLTTVLPRENQHELCVIARKFRNLHIFGCWWFMNIPYLVDEITRLRIELLGLSFTPQHSDARVLDQIIYKWQHSRRIIARVLAEKYEDLARAGWTVTDDDIRRDVQELFGGAFERFCGKAG